MVTYEYEKGPGRSIVIVVSDEHGPVFARRFRDLVTAQTFVRDATACHHRGLTRSAVRELSNLAVRHGGLVPQEEPAQ